MSQYLFLRAYMAGLVTPAVFSVVLAVGAAVSRHYFAQATPPLERYMILPIVLVPNLWGAWNGLWSVLPRRLPLGWHGALLPIVNFALGSAMVFALDIHVPEEMKRSAPASLAISMVGYYLLWKYVVGFLNTLVDVD